MLMAIGVMVLAVALTSFSNRLDEATRSAQARVADLKALGDSHPVASRSAEQTESVLEGATSVLERCERIQRLDLLRRLEWASYDWRLSRRQRSTTNIAEVGLVKADDNTILSLAQGDVISGTPYNLQWPRWPVYGRALRELRAQGARAVGFDVTFQELQHESGRLEADYEFADELGKPGAAAVIAMFPGAEPAPLFQYRVGAGVGDVATTKDVDSVARRVRALTVFRQLNPRLGELAYRWKWILSLGTNQDSLLLQTNPPAGQPPDPGRGITADELGIVRLPTGRFAQEKLPLWVTNRVWHLGLVLAAYQRQIDLQKSGIEGSEMVLRLTNGAVQQRFPIDANGFFPVNWVLRQNQAERNRAFEVEKIENLIRKDVARQNPNWVPPTSGPAWSNRVVVIGSTASGNNLADRGATPVGGDTDLVVTHLNVVQQILSGEHLRIPSLQTVQMVMVALAGLVCALTWWLRGLWAPIAVLLVAVAWCGFAVWESEANRRFWPMAYPLAAGLLMPFVAMVTSRAVVEQRERHRIRSVFSKMVSPDIVQEMLGGGRIELGGARRELSVLFADVRGFTALTDRSQVEAEEFIARHSLVGAAATAHHDAKAHEVLDTVNLYLGALADVVKFHQGTLDKYIGDCVMAFWGAPVSNPRHGLHCVSAAIDGQRIVARLNAARGQENLRRARTNAAESGPAGEQSLLPLLELGTGVNSGTMTVGLMGSDAHIVNFTVFGREVNLASRLEGVSGHSRIVIGESTHAALVQFAPALAALCLPLEPVVVKGFRAMVRIYEVPWQTAAEVAGTILPLYEATPALAFRPGLKLKPPESA